MRVNPTLTTNANNGRHIRTQTAGGARALGRRRAHRQHRSMVTAVVTVTQLVTSRDSGTHHGNLYRQERLWWQPPKAHTSRLSTQLREVTSRVPVHVAVRTHAKASAYSLNNRLVRNKTKQCIPCRGRSHGSQLGSSEAVRLVSKQVDWRRQVCAHMHAHTQCQLPSRTTTRAQLHKQHWRQGTHRSTLDE